MLRQHAPELEPPLRKALAQRQRAWETVLAIARGHDSADVFPGVSIERRADGISRPESAATEDRVIVATSVANPGNIELEVVFGPSWRQASSIGLVLNFSPPERTSMAGESAGQKPAVAQGYYCRLRTSSNMRDASGGVAGDVPVAFAEEGKAATVTLEIARGTTILSRQTIERSALVQGNLRMSAGRSAERVWVQVGNQPPLSFRDIFPISRSQPGHFALVWPPGVTLVDLRGRRQRLPAATSALERGDDFFSQQRFSEALEAYEAEQIAGVGGAAAQEARYKAALCLAALERPETRQRLQELAVEEGDRWPILAACRVWADDLRQRRLDDADAVFESLRGRYRFEQLAALIPSDLRAEILNGYNEQAMRFSLFSRDPHRVERLRRAVDAEDLLGSANHAHYSARWSLLRALEANGRLEEALSLAEQMVGEGGPWHDAGAINWIDEDCWLLSLAGRADEALARVDRQLFDAAGQYRDGRTVLLLGRTRLLVALRRWEEAEHDIDEYFRHFTAADGGPYYPMAALVRGMLHERRGDKAGAVDAWRQGYSLDDLLKQNGTTLTANMMMGSLTGDMTEEQAAQAFTQLMSSFARATPFAAIKDMVRVPGSVLREAWRRPRGVEVAAKIAFRLVPMADYIRLPAVVMGTELARQSAFGGQWTDEQEEIVWKLVANSLDRYFDGSVSMPQFAALGMTWKGSTNFLGWGGVSNTLPTAYRAELACLFAHRYRSLGKADEARAFLATALADSPTDSLVHRLAEAEAGEEK